MTPLREMPRKIAPVLKKGVQLSPMHPVDRDSVSSIQYLCPWIRPWQAYMHNKNNDAPIQRIPRYRPTHRCANDAHKLVCKQCTTDVQTMCNWCANDAQIISTDVMCNCMWCTSDVQIDARLISQLMHILCTYICCNGWTIFKCAIIKQWHI